jgi:hypothetical protein
LLWLDRDGWVRGCSALLLRGENGIDIFRPYSRPNSFKGVRICLSPDIQNLISYPYSNTQIVYLSCRYTIIFYPEWLTLSYSNSNSNVNMKTNVIGVISLLLPPDGQRSLPQQGGPHPTSHFLKQDKLAVINCNGLL